MTLFSAWSPENGPGSYYSEDGSQMRARIAAGEKLFNTAAATITDVRGLNDDPALGSPAVIKGTCTTCHDTPNVGNHSMPLPLDIGTSRQAAFESNPDIFGLRNIRPISRVSDLRMPECQPSRRKLRTTRRIPERP